MAQSLFITLKQQSPGCEISVLAPEWSRPILERMPEVTGTISLPFVHGQFAFLARREFGRSLAGHGFDQAIVLPNSWKSALIPYAAGIPLRTGWTGELRYRLLNDIRPLDKGRYRRTVERFVALGLNKNEILPQIPAPQLVADAEGRETALDRLGLSQDMPVLALCPGAEYGSAKQWPAEYYAQLAERYHRKGWQVWVFGSDKDSAVAGEMSAICSTIVDLTGKTSLAEVIDLMSCASAVVSNDSGLMHVAAALQRPLVAIYGSSDPEFTPPLSENSRVLSLGLSCSPCFKRECPLGHLDCLRKIAVSQVADEVELLLGNGASRRPLT